MEFGDDEPEETSSELDKRIKRASEAGMTDKSVNTLRNIITKNSSAFKLRLGSGGAARIPQLTIPLDERERPVKIKLQRYAVQQRNFIDSYFSHLVSLGLVKACAQASWQADLHLVPKDSKSLFRTTIDLRPVNAATKPKQWHMPNIRTERSDFKGTKCFASLNFCVGYWQCPLDPTSYDACGIITPLGTFSSITVLLGSKNLSSYFQSPVTFDYKNNAMKAWIDDFKINGKNGNRTIRELGNFFQNLCKIELTSFCQKNVRFIRGRCSGADQSLIAKAIH